VGGLAVAIHDTDTPAPRRTLYGFIDRQNLPGILRSFDFASPDTSSAGRFQTTVPQQALFWLNSAFVAGQARALIARPDVKALDGDARVKRLYALAFQRAPTRRELAAAREFLRQAPPLPKTAVTSMAEAAAMSATEAAKPAARTDGGPGKRGGRASSKAPAKPPEPLGPWEQYAQVLLAANEFSFID